MLVAASILFIFLYVVGIPLTFILVLLHYKKRNLLNNEVVMGRIGFLYARYEPSWYWWEVCFHQISLCLLLCLHLCCHSPSFWVATVAVDNTVVRSTIDRCGFS